MGGVRAQDSGRPDGSRRRRDLHLDGYGRGRRHRFALIHAGSSGRNRARRDRRDFHVDPGVRRQLQDRRDHYRCGRYRPRRGAFGGSISHARRRRQRAAHGVHRQKRRLRQAHIQLHGGGGRFGRGRRERCRVFAWRRRRLAPSHARLSAYGRAIAGDSRHIQRIGASGQRHRPKLRRGAGGRQAVGSEFRHNAHHPAAGDGRRWRGQLRPRAHDAAARHDVDGVHPDYRRLPDGENRADGVHLDGDGRRRRFGGFGVLSRGLGSARSGGDRRIHNLHGFGQQLRNRRHHPAGGRIRRPAVRQRRAEPRAHRGGQDGQSRLRRRNFPIRRRPLRRIRLYRPRRRPGRGRHSRSGGRSGLDERRVHARRERR